MGLTIRPTTVVKIEVRGDTVRINGLVFEDKVRTTDLVQEGAVAEHPNAAVDIPEWNDRRHGIPTHVKSVQQPKAKDGEASGGSLGMACSYRLLLLEGTHRLVIGLYDEERHVIDGVDTTVYCYHTIIEVILTQETLDAMRGEVTVEEVMAVRDAVAVCVYHPDTVERERERLHKLTGEMRERMGIASHSVKFDRTNRRVQAQMSISALRDQVEGERSRNPDTPWERYREHTDEFYGLKLPWRTTAKERVFSNVRGGSIGVATAKRFKPAPRRPTAKRRKKPAPAADPFRPYLERWEQETRVPIPGGTLIVRSHDDHMHTAHAEGHIEARRDVWRAFHAMHGKWHEGSDTWLVTPQQGLAAVAKIRELPDATGPSIMRQDHNNERLYSFRTPIGKVKPFLMPKGNWALHFQETRAIAELINEVCIAYNIEGRHLGWDHHGRNWVILDKPADLIERVCRAIQNHLGRFPAAQQGETT